MQSREIRLKSRPVGLPRESDFEAVEVTLGGLGDGHVRVRNRFLSTDPYMRGRMMEGPAAFALDAAIPGRAMGEVTASRAPGFAPGDVVRSMAGWREVADLTPGELEIIETRGLSPHHFIAAAGVMETTLPPLHIAPPLHSRRLDFFRKSFVFSTTRAQSLLGFQPAIDFRTGAADTVSWYRARSLLPRPAVTEVADRQSA